MASTVAVATSAADSSPRPYTFVLVLSAAQFVDLLGYAMVLPLTPVSAARITSPADEASVLLAYSFGMLLMASCLGFGTVRVSLRRKMLASATALLLSLCIMAFAGSLCLFLLGRVIEGASAAATGITGYAAVAHRYPTRRTRMLGFLIAGSSAGLMVGPIVSGFLHRAGGYLLPFAALGLLIAALAAVEYRWLAPAVPTTSAETNAVLPRTDECRAARLHGRTGARGQDPWRVRLSGPLPLLMMALSAASWASFEALMPLRLYQRYAQSPAAIGILFSLLSLCSFATNLMMAAVGHRKPPRFVGCLGLACMAGVFLALVGLQGLYGIALVLCLGGVAYALIANTSATLLGAGARQNDPMAFIRAYAAYFAVTSIGVGMVSTLGLVVATAASFTTIVLVMACLTALALPVAMLSRDAPADA